MVKVDIFVYFLLLSTFDFSSSQSTLNWIGQNILSIVLVFSTVAYTYINWLVLKENKATRNQKTTPLIIAFLEFSEIDETQIILKIKNIGEELAQNISFNFTKDYEWVNGSFLSERGALKHGISSFPPQYELNYILVVKTAEINFNDKSCFVEFDIKYQNSRGKLLVNNYRLNFNDVTMQGYTNPPSTFKRAHIFQLKEINKYLKEIGESNDKAKTQNS